MCCLIFAMSARNQDCSVLTFTVTYTEFAASSDIIHNSEAVLSYLCKHALLFGSIYQLLANINFQSASVQGVNSFDP